MLITAEVTPDDIANLRFLDEMCSMRVIYYEKTTSRTGTRNRFDAARNTVRKIIDNALGHGTVPSPSNHNQR